MEKVQQLAGRVICAVLGGRNLNQALDAALRAAPGLSAQERAAAQDLCYGTLRFYGRLDFILGRLLHKPLQDERLRCLLLAGLYQLEYGRSVPHAVVDHAVRAARRLSVGSAGLVNAVLRQIQRNRPALLAAADAQPASRYAYPQWWVEEITAQYGDKAEEILLAGNQHPPMTLRVNRRRIASKAYLAMLEAAALPASPTGPDGLMLERPVPVTRLPGFQDGLVSVQDAGAQLAAHLLDATDGMRVLDACAAPGGKTAHILELARVELQALDKDEMRLQRVRENLDRLGLDAQVTAGDAADPDNWWDGKPFQRILADAPCSASGVVRRHPDIKWLRRREDIVGFAQQQAQILRTLWQLLATDGKLLYSTCSVFHQENGAVITEFLRQHKDARLLPTTGTNEGQLLPNDQHDGFYYALLQKLA